MKRPGPTVTDPVPPFAGRVAGILENAVERPYTKMRTTAGPISVPVEPARRLLDPERTRGAIAISVKLVDQPDGLGLDRIDLQALLDLGAPALGLDHAVSQRRCRSVPEALLGGLPHGPRDVLAILLGGILI